jgi:hypothetical protein
MMRMGGGYGREGKVKIVKGKKFVTSGKNL